MALMDIAHHRVFRLRIARPANVVSAWLARRRSERKKKLALRELLFTPEHRLLDLGINRDDIIREMQHRR